MRRNCCWWAYGTKRSRRLEKNFMLRRFIIIIPSQILFR
jgi:hypothetical protein